MIQIEPADSLRGAVRTPGDKSISHRAVMLSALADGASSIEGCSSGEDVHGTIRIVAQLGATVVKEGGQWRIFGPSGGLSSSPEPLDCGNSGTTMRLLCGLLASAPGDHLLVGDDSLSLRPMDRVAGPLGDMGVRIDGQGDRCTAPLRVRVAKGAVRAIDYDVPVPSAQVKSAVLLAALAANGETVVHESLRTRANTEEMLRAAGVDVTSSDDGAGRRVRVRPSRPVRRHWVVPGDPSQAAFFVTLAALHQNAEIHVPGLYAGVERTGFLSVLERMGAQIERREHAGVLDVVARSSTLVATSIHASEIPSVDEVPVLAVAAASASGVTRFHDVGELRIKESDRFAETISLLTLLGAASHAEGDDLVVEGLGDPRRFAHFSYEGALDHRMVMSAAVAGAVGSGCELSNTDTVATSYPGFFDDLARLA